MKLHSREAKEMMLRYRIGRIEGRWQNFVPPIQGGKFRPYVESEPDNDGEGLPETEQSSPAASRPPSEVFDLEEPTIRQRREFKGGALRSSSASSTSSITDDERDGLSYLDAETKQQMDLDISKYPSLDPATQDEIVAKYRLLNQRLWDEGYYDCNYMAYG
ncbi:hypothetical protein DH86_00002022, partial [Scytalidium sp. 3C]